MCVCVGGGRVRKRGTIKDLGGGGKFFGGISPLNPLDMKC